MLWKLFLYIVSLQLSALAEIDKDEGLYLVESNSKPGVVNQSGKIIVYQDYDQIGLDGTISDGNVTNRYLLYGSIIPIRKDKKWGLIDKNGDTILTSYTYDANGNTIKEESGSEEITYGYDISNQMISYVKSSGEDTLLTQTNEYPSKTHQVP